MNNYVHEGAVIDIVAPYEVEAGQGVLMGDLFGIATSWACQGEQLTIRLNGVFDLLRSMDQDWNVGDPIYWDHAERRFVGNGLGNKKVAVAIASTHGTMQPWVRGKLLGVVTA